MRVEKKEAVKVNAINSFETQRIFNAQRFTVHF